VPGNRTKDGGETVKKLIFVVICLLLVYGGYQYVQAYLDFNKLSARIDLIISDPKSHTLDSMEEFILTEAANLGIHIAEEDVEISIRETDRASLGQIMIEREGISVESKLLVIHFSYPVEIYGITKIISYDIEKVFTSKASLLNPYQDGL
jgi:hypothetical protein